MKEFMTFEVCPAEPVRFHDYANLFPMMQGEALDALRADIRQNGVREPVVFLGGAILDGRNRYMCARDLGLEYPRVEFTGDDPLGYVISHNLHRRHLTESQRASVAAKLANMGQGRPSVTAQIQAVSQADAARMLNVGRSSVQAARHVHEAAPEEINRALDDGRISVSLAAKVADLPEAAQAEIIAAPPEQVKEIAREVVKRAHVANNSGNNEWYTPREFIEAARAVLPVWLLFFHPKAEPSESDLERGCPSECPVGLFGNDMSVLVNCENHRSDKYGRSGMVYWAHDSLRQLATVEDLRGQA